jgi:osmoprotectant transport system ATP-binding protein
LIVQFEDVSLKFQNTLILNGITWSLQEHQTLAILGKSGSGKSSILKLINGLLKTNSGNIRVFGENIQTLDLQTMRLKIGYSVQNNGLFPHLNVYDNISILGKILKIDPSNTRKRINHMLSVFQLPSAYAQKPIYQLSGGEQQRVGLCRAFFLKPPLVLMDEAFASLDVKTKSEIYNYLKDLQSIEPCSKIIVTHQIEEAKQLANEFIYIKNGNILKSGSIDTINSIQSEVTFE